MVPVIKNVDNNIEIPDAPDRPLPKKRKHAAMKPPKAKGPVDEKNVCDEKGKDPEGGPVHIGNFILQVGHRRF